jgi:hypothetical protein
MIGRRHLAVRLIVAALALIASPSVVLHAQSDTPLLQELLQVYRDRCLTEIRVFAAQLDDRHEDVVGTLTGPSSRPVLEGVRQAWVLRDATIALYQQLEESPRKFTRWAAEEKLPPAFSLPDSLAQIKRWEALRPVLAAVAGGNRLEWNQPDALSWTSVPGWWRHELLLLLRWLGPDVPRPEPPWGPSARAWASEQAGSIIVRAWRRSTPEVRRFLHDEYTFDLLRQPPAAAPSPPRLAGWLARTSWSGKGVLLDVVGEKDALLIDLLAEVQAANGQNSTALDWFNAASRAFPPFTRFEPTASRDGGHVTAMLARRTPIAPLLEGIRSSSIDPGVKSVLDRAVFAYQARMFPDGRLEAPVAGWSTWVPHDRPSVEGAAPAMSTPSIAAPPLGREAGPENAWHEICAWALGQLAPLASSRPIHVSVINSTGWNGWTFAFRAGELTEMGTALLQPLHIASGANAPAGAVRAQVTVESVEEHRSVTIGLRAPGLQDATLTVRVGGPENWPPWFAVRNSPTMNAWSAIAIVSCVLAGVWIWRQSPRASRSLFAASWAIGPVLVLAALVERPKAVATQELGGVVELSLPLHAATPDGLRLAIREIALATYDQWAGLAVDQARSTYMIGWRDRWRYGFRRLLWLEPPPPVTARIGLAELTYRIRPAVWKAGALLQGPIHAGARGRFESRLDGLVYEGEPDTPSSLLYGPAAGTRVVVSVWDGDHGALRAPPAAPVVRRAPVLSLVAPNPTRDARPESELATASRLRWITDRSTHAFSMADGWPNPLPHALPAPSREMDLHAQSPTDLDVVRDAWWKAAVERTDNVRLLANDAAAIAVSMVDSRAGAGVAGSHTELRLLPSWSRFIGLAIVAVMVGWAYVRRYRGIPPSQVLLMLAVFGVLWILPAIFLLVAAPAWAASVVSIWTYGPDLADATPPVHALWIVTFLIAAWYMGSWLVLLWLGDPHGDEVRKLRAVWSVNWRTQAFPIAGLSIIAMTLVVWWAAPVRDVSSASGWLPPDYWSAVMASVSSWYLGCGCWLYAGSAATRSAT